jgi:hypothetical protein
MKRLFFLILLATQSLALNVAHASPLSRVVDVDGDQVLVSLGPTLTVQNTTIDEGAMIQISLDYDTKKMKAEVDDLQAKYAGKKLVYAHPEPNEDSFHLNIPTLGLTQDVRMMPGQMGAYFHLQTFISDSSKLKAYLDSVQSRGVAATIQISGEVKMTFSYGKLINEIALPGSVCQSIGASGRLGPSLEAIIRYRVNSKVTHADSLDALRVAMLKNCLSLSSSSEASSAVDLMNMGVRVEAPSELMGGYVSPQVANYTSQIFYSL